MWGDRAVRNRTAGWMLFASACLLLGLSLQPVSPNAVLVGFFAGFACALAAVVSYLLGY
jgi:ascorbate-specific PTS system EIIC-type component UlaA